MFDVSPHTPLHRPGPFGATSPVTHAAGLVLAALPQPLMVVLPDRRILFNNLATDSLLSDHGASQRAGRLMQLGQLDATRLDELLHRAASGCGLHAGLWFSPQRSTGWLHACPLPPALAAQADWPADALLLAIHLDQPALTQSARIDALSRECRLSATERHVLMLLGDGMSVEAAATHLELRVSTVRSHVRNLLGKTQMGTLMQLLRWVGSGEERREGKVGG